jgi:hypothetical protein
MAKLYYWEDDPTAEEILEKFDTQGISYQSTVLDPEIPNARPYAEYEGKTYWDLEELLRDLEP